MVSKKLKLLLALAGLMQTASYAQDNTMPTSTSGTDANWVYDSSKVSTKNMPQYNEFTNYQTPYPAKPRSMWELTLNGGNAIIIGDRPMFNGYTGGIAGGISARFALSHVFSVRAGYTGSTQKIPHYPKTGPYIPFSGNTTHMLNLDLIASLNTLSSYRGNPKVNYYIFAGYSIAASQITNKPDGFFNGDGTVYNGADASLPNLYQREQNNLISTFHKDYKGNDNQALYHNLAFGAGIDFRISSRVKFGLEERVVAPLTGLDMLDGFMGPTNRGDKYAFSTAKLSFDLGNAKTHTEPLWWINPNNYIYNEVATPKHMKLPPVVLPDADGDGVTDQFDMEPNTPAGCAVDVHGVSLDTDGDGVPDCRDKEKLTPQNCFPVNADGVGTCPEPECCKNIQPAAAACSLGSLPSVQFKSGSASLSTTAKSLLNNVAQQLMANPNCKVKIVGYGASDKRAQQLSWDHVNAVKAYLTEQQGISETRVIFTYGMDGNATTVDLVPTVEEGPNTVPAPHPNLRKG